ncbi:MAG: hypothetical protein P8H56_02785 [Crocinitomicaceae bacterium]|nr:hypothetical protein [Crocinitomicaceae bacterium]MDG1657490.1 hypothetical protein [Crocinitomicaceae bacterium]
MNTRILSILFTAALFISFSSFSQPRKVKWDRLGSKLVDYRADFDVMQVGAKEGGFTKLKVMVTGGALNMHRMVVTYMNGTKEEIQLRNSFARGTTSRVIDIKGGQRLIKNIKFVYDTKNLARKKAKIHVYGRH